MRRERNTAFFGNKPAAPVGGDAALTKVYRSARQSGKLVLQNRGLAAIPDEIFALADALEEGEKFWEVHPLTKVDLSHNSIVAVADGRFALLQRDLAHLKLRDNQMTALPADLFECEQLRHVDASMNALAILPQTLGCAGELRELLLSENCLETVPASLSGCTLLQVLELQKNRLIALPSPALSLPQLQQLNLSGNRLIELPPSLGTLALLEICDVSKNALRTLPDLTRMRALRFLNASENQLVAAPQCPAASVGKLDRLYLGENNIRVLDVGALRPAAASLTELLLQGNRLESCPDDISCLTALKALDVSNNDLTTLPPSLGYMSALGKIMVEGNPIRSIRRTLLAGAAAEELKAYLRTRGSPPPGYDPPLARLQKVAADSSGGNNVDEAVGAVLSDALAAELDWRLRDSTGGALDLSGLDIPAAVLGGPIYRCLEASHVFQSLATLTLTGNKLTCVPAVLQYLPSLRRLGLGNNLLGARAQAPAPAHPGGHRLHAPPPQTGGRAVDAFRRPPTVPLVAALPASLLALDVGHNQLDTAELTDVLESVLHACPGLTELDARGNRVTDVPPAVFALRALRELQLSHNQIGSLAAEPGMGAAWARLSALEVLDASNNRLRRLDNVSLPPALSSLLLANNDIADVPPELALLTRLQTLSLTGNPLRNIRPTIVAQGAGAVLAVLKNRLPEVPAPLQPFPGEEEESERGYEREQGQEPTYPPSAPATATTSSPRVGHHSYQGQYEHHLQPPRSDHDRGHEHPPRGPHHAQEQQMARLRAECAPAPTARGSLVPVAPRSLAGGAAPQQLTAYPSSAHSGAADRYVLAREIEEMEAEMDRVGGGSSGAARKMQLKKAIALKRVSMLRTNGGIGT